MKKIILSVSIIAAVAAIAFGVTTAFFSDTETSTGNTFTAGSIDLKVDSTCHYDNMICNENHIWANESGKTSTYPELLGLPCSCTWGEKDLTGEAFFNFRDVKPGDIGENTISLHADNNSAWLCAEITNLVDKDNGCNEPEAGTPDTTCADLTTGEGELAENLYFTIWEDNSVNGKCDNVRQDGEKILVNNQPASNGNWALYDSTTQTGAMPGDQTVCLGVAWNIPSGVGNIVQTDSLAGDVKFSIVQSRNNSDFRCVEPTNGPISFISAVGAINDQGATSKEWYMRHVGNPGPAGYSHAYQWGTPSITCDPNNAPVIFTGTIDVSSMINGNVAFIGLLDKGLLASGKTGYQSGAYIYVYKMANGKLRIGPTDGNMGGEIVQTFIDHDAPIGGTFNISMTISTGNISLSVDGGPTLTDTYGDVKVLNNAPANGYYEWNEFANGAVLGWDNYLSNTMPYNLSVTGCQTP